ncbi:MAG TPA: cytochrome c oxidase subunit 3 family protein [Terriglobia bacterium]|nr:cytochrome c oxidase subunit 3 family protein [Terriglobia bacterium]
MDLTVAHQFDDAEQQQEASTLGMWIFLATEILFFGGMFLGYTVYRAMYPHEFAAASSHLDVVLGTVNTAVLLCSSLTMALGVYSAQLGSRRMLALCLGLTMLLGAVFLGIKFYEYYQKYEEGLIPGSGFTWAGANPNQTSLFFVFYFIMTGMHALHMIIGLGLMTVLVLLTRRGRFTPSYYTPVELGGLYWHFVDIVWVFLFPLLYLIDRSS